MCKLNKVLLLIMLINFCSSAYSQETAVQKQDTAKIMPDLPMKCINLIKVVGVLGSIGVDSKGNIYAEVGNDINVYNSNGEKEFTFELQDKYVQSAWGKEKGPITGIDLDSNDNIFLGNGPHSAVEIFGVDGSFIKKIDIPKSSKKEWYGIDDIAIDNEGTIFVAANFKFIYNFNRDGNFMVKWGKSNSEEEGFSHIFQIATNRYKDSKQKRIYLGDDPAARVHVYDKNKRLLFSFGNRGSGDGQIMGIAGIEVDSEGRIYVLDDVLSHCSVFSTEGKFLFRFGQQKDRERSFLTPTGIFIDNKDNVYIANSGRNNILIWKYSK